MRPVSAEATRSTIPVCRGPPGATIRRVGSPERSFPLAGPKESTSVVTSAQRARLVLSLGVLNIVLASFALAVGIIGPRVPDRGVAGLDRSPVLSSSAPTPLETAPTAPPKPTPTTGV